MRRTESPRRRPSWPGTVPASRGKACVRGMITTAPDRVGSRQIVSMWNVYGSKQRLRRFERSLSPGVLDAQVQISHGCRSQRFGTRNRSGDSIARYCCNAAPLRASSAYSARTATSRWYGHNEVFLTAVRPFPTEMRNGEAVPPSTPSAPAPSFRRYRLTHSATACPGRNRARPVPLAGGIPSFPRLRPRRQPPSGAFSFAP